MHWTGNCRTSGPGPYRLYSDTIQSATDYWCRGHLACLTWLMTVFMFCMEGGRLSWSTDKTDMITSHTSHHHALAGSLVSVALEAAGVAVWLLQSWGWRPGRARYNHSQSPSGHTIHYQHLPDKCPAIQCT